MTIYNFDFRKLFSDITVVLKNLGSLPVGSEAAISRSKVLASFSTAFRSFIKAKKFLRDLHEELSVIHYYTESPELLDLMDVVRIYAENVSDNTSMPFGTSKGPLSRLTQQGRGHAKKKSKKSKRHRRRLY
jgi:uroporphyrinogen-III decarboxylase